MATSTRAAGKVSWVAWDQAPFPGELTHEIVSPTPAGLKTRSGSVMRSSNRGYMASVDHLRAFAAVLVVAYHGTQLFSVGIRRGNAGFDPGQDWLYSRNPILTVLFEGHTAVALFMVLSGFIFTVGTLGQDISWPRFMANRLLRIYPMFVVLLLIGYAMQPGAFQFTGLLQMVTGFGNYQGAANLGPVSTMFWAIGVEMQFYLIFPLLNRMLGRLGMRTFLRFFVAIVVIRGVAWAVAHTTTGNPPMVQMMYVNIVGRIDQFLLGMIAAWLYVNHRSRFAGWWKVGVSAGAVIVALWGFNQAHGYMSDSPWRLVWMDVEGLVWAGVIVTYVATFKSTGRISALVAKLGERSYSMYLIHFMVISILVARGGWIRIPGLPPAYDAMITTALYVLPIVIAISTLTYSGVEVPFLKMRIKYLTSTQRDGTSHSNHSPRIQEPATRATVTSPPAGRPTP